MLKATVVMSDSRTTTYPAGAVKSEASGESSKRPPLRPSKVVVLADLNVDPPETDAFPDSLSRLTNDESSQDKSIGLSKDTDMPEAEGKQFKKLGKCRSRIIKADFPVDCGVEADGDQNGSVPSSREEKVSSLKTGLVHVAKKMPKNAHAHFILGLMYQRMGQPQKSVLAYEKAEEILLRSEEEIDRPDLLSLVQVHHAQCLLLGSSEDYSLDKELGTKELEEIIFKLKESMNSDMKQASVWNTLGMILLKSGRLQNAISVFSSLLGVAPDNLDCLGNLGIAYLQSGNLELATKCFQDAILKDQNHPASLINYAALLLCKHGAVVAGAGANDDGASEDQVTAVNVAKECLLAAVKADPKAAHIWTNLANAYYMTGDHRSSGKCLEKAGKLESNCLATRYAIAVHRIRDAERSQNPSEQLSWAGNEMASIIREGDSVLIEPPLAWAGLAMVHKAQHEIAAGFDVEQHELIEVEERALYSLKQAIQEDPDDAVQWHQLGLHRLCTQQFKTAQKYLKVAVARSKGCSYAWSNLGVSLQLSEETSSQAEEIYKQALSLTTSQQAHVTFSNLGNLYRQQKQYESAKAMFTKSLELRPGYAPAYNNLGLVFVAEDRWEEAKYCFNKALQADPLLDAAMSNMVKASAMSRAS